MILNLRKEGREDKIHDLEEARKVAQEYANTGFHKKARKLQK